MGLPIYKDSDSSSAEVSSSGGSEVPRLFVGGIPMRMTEAELENYFSMFGDVKEVVVRRGFGFVSFHDPDSTQHALAVAGGSQGHVIAGRRVDVKRAKRDGRGQDPPMPKRCGGYDPVRIFVGGIPMDVTSSELRDYFSGYGEVDKAVIQTDRSNGQSRGFGFITFVCPESVDAVMKEYYKHRINNKWIEVKRCVPPNDPNVLERPEWFGQVGDDASSTKSQNRNGLKGMSMSTSSTRAGGSSSVGGGSPPLLSQGEPFNLPEPPTLSRSSLKQSLGCFDPFSDDSTYVSSSQPSYTAVPYSMATDLTLATSDSPTNPFEMKNPWGPFSVKDSHAMDSDWSNPWSLDSHDAARVGWMDAESKQWEMDMKKRHDAALEAYWQVLQTEETVPSMYSNPPLPSTNYWQEPPLSSNALLQNPDALNGLISMLQQCADAPRPATRQWA